MYVVHIVLISRSCFLGNARVTMGIVYAAARAYCLPMEWTGTLLRDGLVAACQRSGHGTLNAEAAHRLPVEWIGLIKCRGSTSPASGIDRRRTLSAINAAAARPRDLTSGSIRWLTSRAMGHVAASGPRLSGSRCVHGMVRTRVGSRPPPGLD
jgi:hypothetical protein